MGVLMLTCPSTAREFSTSIMVDEDTFGKLPNVATRRAARIVAERILGGLGRLAGQMVLRPTSRSKDSIGHLRERVLS